MTHAVEACVHCGFCLAACPTYRELGQERWIRRSARISALMKEVLEGTLPVANAQLHIDRCLGCLACEPAGPPERWPSRIAISSVRAFRALMQSQMPRTLGERLRRFLADRRFPTQRLRLAALFGRFGKLLRPPPCRRFCGRWSIWCPMKAFRPRSAVRW